MVVSDADSVGSTSVLVADIVTGVSQSIAELSGRTVDVVDAGNGSTSFDSVVRVTCVESRWTFAVRHVIVNHAESIRSTRNKVADWLTAQQTLLRAPAGLVLRALAVGGTVIFFGRLTTLTVVWIAYET